MKATEKYCTNQNRTNFFILYASLVLGCFLSYLMQFSPSSKSSIPFRISFPRLICFFLFPASSSIQSIMTNSVKILLFFLLICRKNIARPGFVSCNRCLYLENSRNPILENILQYQNVTQVNEYMIDLINFSSLFLNRIQSLSVI